MMLVLILSYLIDMQGREPYLCDFVETKNFKVGFYSEIY